MTIKGKNFLTFHDIENYSMWKWDEGGDFLYPVTCKDELPEDIFDLLIRAKFSTPIGIDFLGYVVGLGDIFSIGIFLGEKAIGFNLNLSSDYPKKFEKLSKFLKRKLSLSDISPLHYITDIDLEGFSNIEGEFNLLRKITHDERLKGF